jgi:hypothetical protein
MLGGLFRWHMRHQLRQLDQRIAVGVAVVQGIEQSPRTPVCRRKALILLDTCESGALTNGYALNGRFYLIPQDYNGGTDPAALAARAIGQRAAAGLDCQSRPRTAAAAVRTDRPVASCKRPSAASEEGPCVRDGDERQSAHFGAIGGDFPLARALR